MADEKPVKVKVEALKFHSNSGADYQVGDTYEVDEAAVDNLVNQGMAVRVDRAAVAKASAKAAEKQQAEPAKPAVRSTTRAGAKKKGKK